MENCDVYDNEEDGIKISTGSQPTIKGCRIFSNAQSGVYAYNGGSGGHLLGCYIWGNGNEAPIRTEKGAEFLSQEGNVLATPAVDGGGGYAELLNFGPGQQARAAQAAA